MIHHKCVQLNTISYASLFKSVHGLFFLSIGAQYTANAHKQRCHINPRRARVNSDDNELSSETYKLYRKICKDTRSKSLKTAAISLFREGNTVRARV